MVTFSCSQSRHKTPLPHSWEHTVGSGHAALALRADWQTQLEKSHRDLGMQHVRFHGLLSAPMDTLTCQRGAWLYSFFDSDRIMDFLLSIRHAAVRRVSLTPWRTWRRGARRRLTMVPTSPRLKDTRCGRPSLGNRSATGSIGMAHLRSAPVALRGLERAQPGSFLVPGKQDDLFHAVSVHGRSHQERGRGARVSAAPRRPRANGSKAFVAFCRANTICRPTSSAPTSIPTDAFGSAG